MLDTRKPTKEHWSFSTTEDGSRDSVESLWIRANTRFEHPPPGRCPYSTHQTHNSSVFSSQSDLKGYGVKREGGRYTNTDKDLRLLPRMRVGGDFQARQCHRRLNSSLICEIVRLRLGADRIELGSDRQTPTVLTNDHLEVSRTLTRCALPSHHSLVRRY